ncbi:rRNA methyltransferase [Candidatus Bealeia paramacronuclearis]|uniref:rRNA methyltransferase n=1 Tax=Candidatus Bealeia paramacronuclearis TaxID=1921001 RepID=A0ABZ2C525_9PROT|nr:rRNA methyltransferase [Candidatus Bealeia paramacronuclearis]
MTGLLANKESEIFMESLPLELSNAIDRELAPLHPDRLRDACFELSNRYSRESVKGPFITTTEHRHAYIAARLPATYGAMRQIFRRIEAHKKNVKSILDLGSGVGSIAWAAKDAFPKLKSVMLVEEDLELLRLGQYLTDIHLDPLQLSWCHENLIEQEGFPVHDVVTMSYVLNELSPHDQLVLLNKAYLAADQLLILAEPGTPQGFANILRAREFLIKQGAHVLAPCTHNNTCPLAQAFHDKKDWCHFSVRIPRGKYHRRAKAAALPYEDEKYSYLVVSPMPLPTPQSRIIKSPILNTGHVILDLCDETGAHRKTISKSQGKIYRAARDAEWGDALNPSDFEGKE